MKTVHSSGNLTVSKTPSFGGLFPLNIQIPLSSQQRSQKPRETVLLTQGNKGASVKLGTDTHILQFSRLGL